MECPLIICYAGQKTGSRRLGISYNKLSDVEFRQLVHILEKSKYFKSYVGQRKKRK